MANIIKGNGDGNNGSNNSYSIPGRGTNIPRPTIVREVKQGKHPHHGTYKINGKTFVRAKPNSNTGDNVNPE